MAAQEPSKLCRIILDSVPVAMMTMDYDFKITSFNGQAEKLTGYSEKEAVGRPCHEILQSSRCESGCPIKSVHDNKKSTLGQEATFINRFGEMIYVRIAASAMTDDEHNFAGYLEIIEDITRQKKIEREKHNFISMIAHDMKSPLIGISGLIKRLQKEKVCKTNKKLQEYLRVIGEAEERLASMVEEFLEYSRLESGQIQLRMGKTDIKDVLDKTLELHRLRAEEQQIALKCECQAMGPIEADEKRLHRVFSNIIDNAIKYSPHQSEVTIKTIEKDDEIIIQIQDQGWGIKTEEIPFIFDAFYRAEKKENVSGYGLGLAASNTIIREHGGRISVESVPGKGSIFTVRLPKQRSQESIFKG
ncbi:MAG: PAS domain-containing sensor histidine kinase [Desulfobulbaceae bacterium]